MKAILISLLLSVLPLTFALAQQGDRASKEGKSCCAQKSSTECTMDKKKSSASTTGTASKSIKSTVAGAQQATIVVNDGYSPQAITVKRGVPVRLNFDLQKNGCFGTVVFKDFNIEQKLAVGKSTPVEFIPTKAGTFAFTCPMGMGDGRLIVQ